MDSKTLKVRYGTGVTSCLSVRLHEAIHYKMEKGEYPEKIDSSAQFEIYRDYNSQDISEIVFGKYIKPNKYLNVQFNHGWQYAWYDEINIKDLSGLANEICPLSSIIGDKAFNYKKEIGNRTAILYRGNDKSLEIPRTHYDAIIEMAKDSKSDKFIVQTDEIEFLEYFKNRFKDTISFSDIPMINKNPDKYVMPDIGKRVKFMCNFLSALYAISSADKLIMNTGNTGLWCALFRGNVNNVWQVNTLHQKWRKLA